MHVCRAMLVVPKDDELFNSTRSGSGGSLLHSKTWQLPMSFMGPLLLLTTPGAQRYSIHMWIVQVPLCEDPLVTYERTFALLALCADIPTYHVGCDSLMCGRAGKAAQLTTSRPVKCGELLMLTNACCITHDMQVCLGGGERVCRGGGGRRGGVGERRGGGVRSPRKGKVASSGEVVEVTGEWGSN